MRKNVNNLEMFLGDGVLIEVPDDDRHGLGTRKEKKHTKSVLKNETSSGPTEIYRVEKHFLISRYINSFTFLSSKLLKHALFGF